MAFKGKGKEHYRENKKVPGRRIQEASGSEFPHMIFQHYRTGQADRFRSSSIRIQQPSSTIDE